MLSQAARQGLEELAQLALFRAVGRRHAIVGAGSLPVAIGEGRAILAASGPKSHDRHRGGARRAPRARPDGVGQLARGEPAASQLGTGAPLPPPRCSRGVSACTSAWAAVGGCQRLPFSQAQASRLCMTALGRFARPTGDFAKGGLKLIGE